MRPDCHNNVAMGGAGKEHRIEMTGLISIVVPLQQRFAEALRG